MASIESEEPNWERECTYCGNDTITEVIAHPDGEVICGICGSVLGRLDRSLPVCSPVQVIEEWSGSRDNAEGTLEKHVGRYGW